MGSLAGTTLQRAGVTEIVVANRTADRATALADSLQGTGMGLNDLTNAIANADVVISSTGANGLVVESDVVRAAMATRDGRPLFILDLALPRDVDPDVREIEGVRLADLDALRAVLDTEENGSDLDECRRIVNDEVGEFLAWQRSMRVAPTVVALRAKADALINEELARLGDKASPEVETAVRRVVDKLLHAPTVRVKQLASAPGGDSYAEALRELFELDQQAVDAVAAGELPLLAGGSEFTSATTDLDKTE
jgi:glutamyl-tRNA reductase